MASYCNAGDTARVTLPDGDIQDFTDTPISVDIKPGYGDGILFINIYWRATPGGGLIETNTRVDTSGRVLTHVSFDDGFFANYTDGSRRWIAGTDYKPYYRIDYYHVYHNGQRIFSNNPSDYINQPSAVALTITNLTGDRLFTGTYDNQNYLVNCIKQCPPNTLDCGDCCLPCDEIFNSISDIRKLISRIN
jgi:hypothetical protein